MKHTNLKDTKNKSSSLKTTKLSISNSAKPTKQNKQQTSKHHHKQKDNNKSDKLIAKDNKTNNKVSNKTNSKTNKQTSNQKDNNKYIKQYGRGLPTLLTKKCFSFHEKAKIPDNYKSILENDIAVDIVMKILGEKLNKSGPMNRIYFLNARTGSGKSTTFINHLYDTFIRGINCKLYVTEPRVPLCSANASEIVRWTSHPEDKMGENVGYLTGPAKVRCNSSKGILYYCTPQIVANQLNTLLTEETLTEQGYIKIVVIDESHLLDMPTLQTLNIIYNVIEKHGSSPFCPLFVFASATLNLEPFVNYYQPLMNISHEEIYKDYTMIGYVSGSANFDVKLKYLNNEMTIPESKDPVMTYGEELSLYIAKNNLGLMLNQIPAGENGNDLLIFIPKMALAKAISDNVLNCVSKTEYKDKPVPVFKIEKGALFNELEAWRNQNRNQLRVLIVPYARGYAKAADELLKTAVEQDAEARVWERKIYISTPIIETGKTIASLRYCYDTGLELKPSFNPLVYNPYDGFMNLKIFPINQSSATQRLGRVGREQTGECLRLYTKEIYDMLDKSESPETVNNYCLSPVLLSKLQTLPLYQYYDIINDNNYLFKISIDIQLRTICDLINSGFYSLFGYVSDTITPMANVDTLSGYIQQLYYIKGYSLFRALLVINLNFKNLSSEITPLRIQTNMLPNNVDDPDNLKPEMDIIEGIKKSRNIITQVEYDQTYRLFKFMYSRLYEDIERRPYEGKREDKNNKGDGYKGNRPGGHDRKQHVKPDKLMNDEIYNGFV